MAQALLAVGWFSSLSCADRLPDGDKELAVPRPVAEEVVKEGRRRAIAEMPSQSKKVQ